MKLRTWFSGILECQTALHLGTGTVLSTVTDAPILRGADGRPLIPGSSVKGALRSASERLLRALGHRACVVFGNTPPNDKTLDCLTTDEKGRELFFKLKSGEPDTDFDDARTRFSPPDAWGRDPWEDFGQREERQLEILNKKLCRACLTWGSQFLAGRVRVPDLRLTATDKSALVTTEIRDGVGIHRDTGTAANAIKFDLEVLPAGARFGFELIAEPEAERAVVALAVGELLQGTLPLGGRVTRGLGDVQLKDFVIREVNLANPDELVAYLARGKQKSYSGKDAETRLDQILTELVEGSDAA